MSKQTIVTLPAPVLRRAAADVPLEEITNAAIRSLIAVMRETLAATPDGVGLAAPQLGVSLRIFIASEEAFNIGADGKAPAGEATAKPKQWPASAYINPRLEKRARRRTVLAEGCLSVPGKYGLVPRAEKVSLAWLDEIGRKHSRGFTGFFARVIQHELDHLDGILISDRAQRLTAVPGSRPD